MDSMEGLPFTSHRFRYLTHGAALVGALLMALALAFAATGVTSAAPRSRAQAAAPAVAAPPTCGPYTQSQHIYDCAGLLTTAEISALEAKAQAVRAAGAPVVVYLQAKDATYDQTLKDAADLMARWDIESSAGAKDGLVILLNLKPGDLRHGQVALYAGQTLLRGPLPQSELSRIYQDVMLPDLRTGDTASGIGAGLDATATDVRAGHPVIPAPPGQGIARAIGTLPFNIVAALLALLALGMGLLSRRRAREVTPLLPLAPTTTPPMTLTPAMAGALITGKVGRAQMEATILDFARRGLLTLEPVSAKAAQIHLLSDGRELMGYEEWLWQALANQATQEGIIPPDRLYRVASSWQLATDTLRRDLYDRGWLDRDRGRKLTPFIVVASVSFALAIAGVVLGVLAQQPWPFIGAALCVIAGVVALAFGLTIPHVTPAGSEVAQAARNYIAGVAALPPNASVSEALPWLVAIGQAGAYGQRLRMEADHPINQFAAIYPYWLIMHTSMAPPASSTGSVAGATGAAAGGGGAGGAF